jgi:hypothetical protein
MNRLFFVFLLAAAGSCRDLVLIPASTSTVTDPATGVPVSIRVDPFLIAPTETTQAEFEQLMGYNPAHHRGGNHPVETVSWWEAIRYCNRRSERESLSVCYDLASGRRAPRCTGYRLPTDAEWQAAGSQASAEGAQLGARGTRSESALLAAAARGTRAVAAAPPNRHGLYDMLGNVWEWCEDWFDPSGSPYPSRNPRGPDEGLMRVVRGGSFISTTGSWARGYRASMKPDERSRFTGFRVVRSAPPSPATPAANWHEPYQRVPPAFANATGALTPLTEDREKIRARWMAVVGAPAIPPPPPETRLLAVIPQPAYEGRLMELRTEPDSWEKIYLLSPRGAALRPRPVIIVPYYDVDTPAGRNLGGRNYMPLSVRSFAHLAVQHGFLAVAIRWFGESYGERYDEAVANLHTRHPGVTGLGKWVWDAQRLLDWLVRQPQVDPARIGIIGHSLGGKMTLYAAAFDPRIAVAVASEPGIGLTFSNYEDYWYLGERIQKLPPGADHHELLALVAPRPFLLIGGQSADKDESWHYINAARSVYRLLGSPDNIGYVNHRSGHTPTPESVRLAMEWLQHYLEQHDRD